MLEDTLEEKIRLKTKNDKFKESAKPKTLDQKGEKKHWLLKTKTAFLKEDKTY